MVVEGNSVIFGNDHLENVTTASGDLATFRINVTNGDIVKLENPDPAAQDTDVLPVGINNSTVTNNTFTFGDDTIVGTQIESLEFTTESEGANLIGDSFSLSIRLTAGETGNNIFDIRSLPAPYENEVLFTDNSFILGDDDISGFGNIAGDIMNLEISLSPSVFFLAEAIAGNDNNGDGIQDYFLDIDGDGELDIIADSDDDSIPDVTFRGLDGNDGFLGYAYHYNYGFNLFLIDDGGLLKVVYDINADNIPEGAVPNGSFIDISGTQIEFGRDTLESQGGIIDNALLDIPDSSFFNPVLIGDVSQASFSDPDIGLRSTNITFRGETLVFNERRVLEEAETKRVLLNDPINLGREPITQNDESISGMSAFNELFRPSDGTREFDSYYSYSSDGANSRISFAEDIFVFNGNADTSVDYIIQDYRVTPLDEEHVVVEPDFLRFDGVTDVADIGAEFSASADGEIVLSTLSSSGETTTITFNGYQYADYAEIELVNAIPEHASGITDGVYATLSLESAYVFDAFSLPDMPRYLPNLDGTGRATRLIPGDDQIWITNLGLFYSEELTIEQAYGEAIQIDLGQYAPDPAALDDEIDVYELTFFPGTAPSALIPVLTDGPTYVPITFDLGTSGDEAVQYTFVLGTDTNGDVLPSSNIRGEELGSTIYYGFGGDDVFNGGSEEDIIDPGEGMDTARYNEDLVLFEARNYLIGPVNIGGQYMELANAVMMGNLFNYNLSLEPFRLIVEDRTLDRDGRDSIIIEATTGGLNITQLEKILFIDSVFMDPFPYDLYIRGQSGPALDSDISTPNEKLVVLGELDADLDLFLSSSTNDVVIGANNTGADAVIVKAGDGNDAVSLGNNKDGSEINIDGDEGNDILKGGDNDGGTYILNGGDGDDILVGGNNSNGGTYVLNGDDNSSEFVDYLKAGNNDDADGSNYFLIGGLGDDILETGGGTQILDGGEGYDTAKYHADLLVEEARAFINGTSTDAAVVAAAAMNGGVFNYDLSLVPDYIVVEDVREDNPDGTDRIVTNTDSLSPESMQASTEKIDFDGEEYSLFNAPLGGAVSYAPGVDEGALVYVSGDLPAMQPQNIEFSVATVMFAGNNESMVVAEYEGSLYSDVFKIGDAVSGGFEINTQDQNDIIIAGDLLDDNQFTEYVINGGNGDDVIIGGDHSGDNSTYKIFAGSGADYVKTGDNTSNGTYIISDNSRDDDLDNDTFELGSGTFTFEVSVTDSTTFGNDLVRNFDRDLTSGLQLDEDILQIIDIADINEDGNTDIDDLLAASRVTAGPEDAITLEIFSFVINEDTPGHSAVGSLTFEGVNYAEGMTSITNYIDADAIFVNPA